uniref:Uncharacterized protein n=1 Tax=Anopheles minimus TaxID=112268 RepID=A0A182W224_9DIPT
MKLAICIPGTHILLRSDPDATEPVNVTTASNVGSTTRTNRSFPLRYMVNGQFFHIKTAFEVRVHSQSLSAVYWDGEQTQPRPMQAKGSNVPSSGACTAAAVASTSLASTVASGGNNANDFTFRSWTTKEVDACVLTA